MPNQVDKVNEQHMPARPELDRDGGDRPLRVLVADDVEDMRLLVRLQFERDGRFCVVGEAANGEEAIAAAELLQPDVVILDRRMPVLGGIEAIPGIRAAAPHTAIILYTAQSDASTTRAALAAGAFDVVGKEHGARLIDKLTDALAIHHDPEGSFVHVRVGPVPAAAARIWIDNTQRILDAVIANPDVLPAAVPADIESLFRSLLAEWSDVAREHTEFYWAAQARAVDVERIVEQWATIDSLPDESLARLGVTWSPPEGTPFFVALTDGILDALHRHHITRRLGERLSRAWAT